MEAVERVGIVGAGFMGSGIAEAAARAGLAVVLHEPESGPLKRSRARIEKSVERAVAGGKLEPEQAEPLLGRVRWTAELEQLADADLVVEAVVEDAQVKGRAVQAAGRADAGVASNTSSIPIAQLASAHRTAAGCWACTSSRPSL
jgi:3-hydroxybutyryl-CoA dehydrogenase